MDQFFAAVKSVNDVINGIVWGWPMIILILGTGILLTVRSKALQVRKFGTSWGETIIPTVKSMKKGKKKKVKEEKEPQIPKAEAETKQEKKSLLDKCMPYIIDENGVDTSVNEEPLYKLQSVAEILRADSAKALERLSEKYDMSFESLGMKSEVKVQEEIKEKEPNISARFST